MAGLVCTKKHMSRSNIRNTTKRKNMVPGVKTRPQRRVANTSPREDLKKNDRKAKPSTRTNGRLQRERDYSKENDGEEKDLARNFKQGEPGRYA